MKKIVFLIFAFLLLPCVAFAEPWLVCNPQPNTDGFLVSVNGGTETNVLYATRTFSDGKTYAVIADLGPLPEGAFRFTIKAFNAWGQSSAVPFESSKQLPGLPSSLAIAR